MTDSNNIRRKPAQARSKKRVDAILQAAKSLIAEKGSARLKIHDIAKRAEVTPASIYQYFPNKNAITLALAQSVFEETGKAITSTLPTLDTKDDMYAVLQNVVEQYYQLYLNDPALLDVWVSISADKSVQALDLEDSRRNADLIFSFLKEFYDQESWPKIKSVSFLLAHLAGAAVRMALSVEESEGRALVDSFKALIGPGFIDAMLKSHGVDVG